MTTYRVDNFGFSAVDALALYLSLRFIGSGLAMLADLGNPLYSIFDVVGGALAAALWQLVGGVVVGVSYIRQRELKRRTSWLFWSCFSLAVLCIWLGVGTISTYGAALFLLTWGLNAYLCFYLSAEGKPIFAKNDRPVVNGDA